MGAHEVWVSLHVIKLLAKINQKPSCWLYDIILCLRFHRIHTANRKIQTAEMIFRVGGGDIEQDQIQPTPSRFSFIYIIWIIRHRWQRNMWTWLKWELMLLIIFHVMPPICHLMVGESQQTHVLTAERVSTAANFLMVNLKNKRDFYCNFLKSDFFIVFEWHWDKSIIKTWDEVSEKCSEMRMLVSCRDDTRWSL